MAHAQKVVSASAIQPAGAQVADPARGRRPFLVAGARNGAIKGLKLVERGSSERRRGGRPEYRAPARG